MPVPPPKLMAALDDLAAGVSAQRLAAEVDRWQARYHDPAADLSHAAQLRPEQAIAYAVYRMPATYAATATALSALAAAIPNLAPATLLDLGSGAGAATWAAAETFASLQESIALERDPEMTAVARRLPPALDRVSGQLADLSAIKEFPTIDLAIAGYSLNELSPSTVDTVLSRLALSANTVLIVEPGTPRGFAVVRQARERLVSLGMSVAAPCPHDDTCPIVDPDWCHFSVRLPRSALHRRVKKADLGYEDEKFSYVAATRLPVHPANARVLRHPQVRSGHILLRLCTDSDGLTDVTVSKRQGDTYKRARRISWGEPW
ncbi:small ribosomal subunit Rsm22 family protein [Fodinicola feengrottensis]|uniref:small ribosomal subunit Rsm22 family protein n=1 Tax=Fodinicola feengrottensis TaxID=435914 RepID=UPI0031DB7958